MAAERRPAERHDHREGPCDLPTLREWVAELKSERHPHLLWARHRCVWDMPDSYWATVSYCDCPYCTGSYDRRLEGRRERRRARREAAEAATLPPDDED